MGAKEVLFSLDAKEAIKRGVVKLARAVKGTLGPRGRNVILEKKFGSPTVTVDGVTVVKEVELENNKENLGVQLVKEVSTRTNQTAGDGTTTAVVLAEAIFLEGLKRITSGVSPIGIRNGIEKAVNAIVSELKKLAVPVRDDMEKVEYVATISAHGDRELGKQVAEAIKKVGKDGVITVEEGKTLKIETEEVNGLRFDKGYISPHFVTDPERMEAVLEKPYIFIYEEKLSSVKDIVRLLEKIASQKRPLLVIAEDVEGEALATLVVNKLRGVLEVVAVKAPGFGDRKKAQLEDIAILTGGKAITKDLGVKLENVDLSYLGKASKVIVTKEHTTIIEGSGKKENIMGRIAQLKKEAEAATSDYDREQLEQRVAKLSGSVYIIKVGGATESEVKEKKFRVEDAVNAVKAAIEEGIVPGGGVSFLRAREAVKNLKLEGDEKVGADIIYKAVESPTYQIAKNAGWDGKVVISKILENNNKNYGFDAAKEKFCDLMEEGVIDPVKVVRLTLQNASSVSSLLLNTEALIAEIPEKKEKTTPPLPPEY
ncbi:MAG: chaperonin GroEL [Planctomycetota bacterium]